MTEEQLKDKEMEESLKRAKMVMDMVRDFSKWTRREYTILFLGMGTGAGLVALVLWIIQWVQLMQLLGLWG